MEWEKGKRVSRTTWLYEIGFTSVAKRHTLMVVCTNTGNSRDCLIMPWIDRHVKPLRTLA